MAKFDVSKVSLRKKWFESKKEAQAVCAYRRDVLHQTCLGVYRGVKGSRNVGKFFVGSHIEFINIY